MRDLIVILLVALFGTGAALWALSRRPRSESTTYGGGEEREERAPKEAEPQPVERSAPVAPVTTGRPPEPAPRPPEPRATLAVLEFDTAPYTVVMTRPEVVIGRHTQDDIRIADVRVSRHHAKLVAKRGGGFEIHNLTAVRSEPNPMLVNGETREHADIDDGDIVTLGGVSFTLRSAA